MAHEITDPSAMTEDDWREQLSEEQFKVLREAGTEPAFRESIGTTTTTACTDARDVILRSLNPMISLNQVQAGQVLINPSAMM